MNITIIGPTYPYKGGISHFTTVLVQNLRKKHNVKFLSWIRQYPSFLYPVELKDTKSKQPVKTEATFILDFINPITWLQAVITIKKHKSNLLILTWASPIQAPIYFILCILTKLFTKSKILYICHNVLPHENSFYDKPLIKLAFFFADSFIVHSSDDKKILESLVKGKTISKGFLPVYDIFPRQKSYDIKKIKSEYELHRRVLLFFGYIRPYKGLKYLIQAMPKIIEKLPETSLLVIGQFWSKDKPEYLTLIKSLHLEKHIRFIDNYVPDEELAKFFAVSDVVVLPYITATQSAALQTAYAFDKPVIATSVGGLKDVTVEGVTGYVIKSKSIKDIVEKVLLFYKKPFSSKSLINLKKTWTWDRYGNLIQQSYE